MQITTHDKPTKTYWTLFKLAEELLSTCEKHNIVVWAEFGSLIGLQRHAGLIPWDYDGDFGMFVSDKNKFLKALTAEKSDDIIIDIDYYHDDGCLALRLADNSIDVVDLIFYDDTETGVDSVQNDKTKADYPSNDGYCYKLDDFYPLKKTLFLGHQVRVPNNIDNALKVHYTNWREIPSQFENYITSKYLQWAIKPILVCQANNFAHLKELVEKLDCPMILRKTAFLDCPIDKYAAMIENQKTEIFGYDSSITWTTSQTNAKQIWHKYITNNLKFNIIDSPTDDKSLLLTEWNEYVKNKLADNYQFALTWVLTNSPKTTHFHIDPGFAGGFMKLLQGEKIWWCIKPTDYQYLLNKGHTVKTLTKMPMHQIIQLEDNYLFGKIYADVIKDHDLIWFPINTLHKVITINNSYGFGGYL